MIGDWTSRKDGEGVATVRGARRSKAAEASFMAVGVAKLGGVEYEVLGGERRGIAKRERVGSG